MHSSSLTIKGQITIPSDLRKKLGLQPGDKVGFYLENDHIVVFRKENNIEASFGIASPKKSASLDTMEKVIRKRGGNVRG